jgi:teichuronic acid biosynthesis glycosyltransferase TuaC
MRVVVVAEYYPRDADPVSGVWAHRQAVAARDAGADVRVLVLHRVVPPKAALRSLDLAAAARLVRQPRRATLDGIALEYLPFASPPRERSYASWGRWAAPVLRRALQRVGREGPLDLVHAHYAVPGGDAVRRAAPGTPVVVSVHGGDVLWAARRGARSERAVRRSLAHARLVLANSAGIAERSRALGAREVRVVHLGTDVPAVAGAPDGPPVLATVGHLVARKRHADVVRALALLAPRHPELRYVVVGDGPERERLGALAGSLGVADRVSLRGELGHEAALRAARGASVFVLPSVDEAFGVAYVEAMAAGVPAVGCAGEPGPEELLAAGGGIRLVAPRDPKGLAAALDELLTRPAERAALGARARATVEREFTWSLCGERTVRAYEDALR